MPVVPAYISGTFRAYPKGARFIRPCRVAITYGPPITPAEVAALADQDDGYTKIARLIMARIATLKPQ